MNTITGQTPAITRAVCVEGKAQDESNPIRLAPWFAHGSSPLLSSPLHLTLARWLRRYPDITETTALPRIQLSSQAAHINLEPDQNSSKRFRSNK